MVVRYHIEPASDKSGLDRRHILKASIENRVLRRPEGHEPVDVFVFIAFSARFVRATYAVEKIRVGHANCLFDSIWRHKGSWRWRAVGGAPRAPAPFLVKPRCN